MAYPVLPSSVSTYVLAILSKCAYHSAANPDAGLAGWQLLLDSQVGRVSNDAFRAVAYLHEATATVVTAYRGTVDGVDNWTRANLPMIAGVPPRVFEVEVRPFARRVRDLVGQVHRGVRFTFIETGHSLGGMFAQFVGHVFGTQSVSFDSPGIGRVLAAVKREPGVADEGDAAATARHINWVGTPNLVNTAGDFRGVWYRLMVFHVPDGPTPFVDATALLNAVLAFFFQDWADVAEKVRQLVGGRLVSIDLATHSLDSLLCAIDPCIGEPYLCACVASWPTLQEYLSWRDSCLGDELRGLLMQRADQNERFEAALCDQLPTFSASYLVVRPAPTREAAAAAAAPPPLHVTRYINQALQRLTTMHRRYAVAQAPLRTAMEAAWRRAVGARPPAADPVFINLDSGTSFRLGNFASERGPVPLVQTKLYLLRLVAAACKPSGPDPLTVVYDQLMAILVMLDGQHLADARWQQPELEASTALVSHLDGLREHAPADFEACRDCILYVAVCLGDMMGDAEPAAPDVRDRQTWAQYVAYQAREAGAGIYDGVAGAVGIVRLPADIVRHTRDLVAHPIEYTMSMANGIRNLPQAAKNLGENLGKFAYNHPVRLAANLATGAALNFAIGFAARAGAAKVVAELHHYPCLQRQVALAQNGLAKAKAAYEKTERALDAMIRDRSRVSAPDLTIAMERVNHALARLNRAQRVLDEYYHVRDAVERAMETHAGNIARLARSNHAIVTTMTNLRRWASVPVQERCAELSTRMRNACDAFVALQAHARG